MLDTEWCRVGRDTRSRGKCKLIELKHCRENKKKRCSTKSTQSLKYMGLLQKKGKNCQCEKLGQCSRQYHLEFWLLFDPEAATLTDSSKRLSFIHSVMIKFSFFSK